jgi:hypothetical protein
VELDSTGNGTHGSAGHLGSQAAVLLLTVADANDHLGKTKASTKANTPQQSSTPASATITAAVMKLWEVVEEERVAHWQPSQAEAFARELEWIAEDVRSRPAKHWMARGSGLVLRD